MQDVVHHFGWAATAPSAAAHTLQPRRVPRLLASASLRRAFTRSGALTALIAAPVA
jgi:hypothetical protein